MARDAERGKRMNLLPQALFDELGTVPASAVRNAGVFTLGIGADNGAGIFEQIGNDGAHALAGARSGDQFRVAVVRNANELVTDPPQKDFAGLILPKGM